MSSSLARARSIHHLRDTTGAHLFRTILAGCSRPESSTGGRVVVALNGAEAQRAVPGIVREKIGPVNFVYLAISEKSPRAIDSQALVHRAILSGIPER